MANQQQQHKHPTHSPQQPITTTNKAEEPSPTLSRRKTVTKRGRQVKAQFRAFFHKKESSVEQKEQPGRDVITTVPATTTSTSTILLDEKNKNHQAIEPLNSIVSDTKQSNIIVTTTAIPPSSSSSSSSSSCASKAVIKDIPLRPLSPPQPLRTQKKSGPEESRHHPISQPQSLTLTTDLQTENTHLRSALQTALNRSQTLESRLAKADLQTHKATRKSEILQSSLSRANTDFETTRQKLQDTIDHLRSEMTARRGEIEMLLMKEASRVRNLKAGMEQRDKEVEDLVSRLGRTEGKVRILRGEVTRLRGERDVARRENEKLWGLLEDLKRAGDEDTDADTVEVNGGYYGKQEAGHEQNEYVLDKDKNGDEIDPSDGGKEEEKGEEEERDGHGNTGIGGMNWEDTQAEVVGVRGGHDDQYEYDQRVSATAGVVASETDEMRKDRLRRWMHVGDDISTLSREGCDTAERGNESSI